MTKLTKYKKSNYDHKIIVTLSIFLFMLLIIGVGYSALVTNLSISGNILVKGTEPIIGTYDDVLSTTYLSDTYRDKIKTITLQDSVNIPNDVVISWDIGEIHNGQVMAYLKINPTDNTMYDLYIEGMGGLYSNPNSSKLFYNMPNLETINNLTLLDTSKTTNMRSMFAASYKLTSIDLSNFDTSEVTTMYMMFAGMGENDTQISMNLTNIIGLNSLDVSNVANMSNLFLNLNKITTIDISNWNTSNVTNMAAMFNNSNDLSSQLTTIVFGPNFDTSNVVSMNLMFSDNPKLVNLTLTGFNTGNVTDMSNMFSNTTGMSSLDLSSFNASNVINMESMFNGPNDLSSNLETIIFNTSFNTQKVTSMRLMFADNPKLNNLNLSMFDISSVENMNSMFANDTSLKNLNITSFAFDSITDNTSIFSSMPTKSSGAIVHVKDATARSWILNLTSSDRPSDWDTTNIIIG